jgi:branched-chain amino acid transport system permease protein
MGNNPKRRCAIHRYNRATLQEALCSFFNWSSAASRKGCIYGLIALGFVLIYKATETVSFAQGELMMLGAFGGLAGMTMLGFPFWLAVIAAIVLPWPFRCAAGARIVIRPILGQPAFLHRDADHRHRLRGARPDHHDPQHRHRDPHPARALQGPDLEVRRWAALVLNVEQMVVIAATAVLCAAAVCDVPLQQARHGHAGLVAEPAGGLLHGHSGQALNGLVWGLAAAVAAMAGLLLAPITFVHANMGFIGLKAFPAAVVGGFGSLPGAIVGGLIIGIVESLSGFYLPEGFKDIAAYVVVLIMLMVKPNGLFGEKLRKKV